MTDVMDEDNLFKLIDNDVEKLVSRTSDEEVLVQLAEECTELAHAALKLRRSLKDVYPGAPDPDKTLDNLIEEIGDVAVCCMVLGFYPEPEGMFEKTQRWLDRIKESER